MRVEAIVTWACNVRAAVEHEFRAAQRMARGIVERVGDEPPPLAPRPTAPPRTARIIQLRPKKKPGQAPDTPAPGGTP